MWRRRLEQGGSGVIDDTTQLCLPFGLGISAVPDVRRNG